MKFLIKAAAPAMLLALGACGGGADDKIVRAGVGLTLKR